MRVYGDLMNRIMENTLSPIPEVGMGATEYQHSDRHPLTVAWVAKNGKSVILTSDKWRVTSGSMQDGSAKFGFTSDMSVEHGQLATLRKNGSWRWKGQSTAKGSGLVLGRREKYENPSF